MLVATKTWVGRLGAPNVDRLARRNDTALPLPSETKSPGVLAVIALVSAADGVSVVGLDSWLALVEQPPRTDEDPETQDIARTFPQIRPGARDDNEPHRATVMVCVLSGSLLLSVRSVDCFPATPFSSICPSGRATTSQLSTSVSRCRSLVVGGDVPS